MNQFSCKTMKAIVYELMESPILRGRIFVAGGIVPYIYSTRESGRLHSDIDIVVRREDMDVVRYYAKEAGYYKEEYDSKLFSYNTSQTDYGLALFIRGVPVNIAPFEVKGNYITQRNFSCVALTGFDGLMKATLKGIKLEDYIGYVVHEELPIGVYRLEMVKCAKEESAKEKDHWDLEEINRIGIDKERYMRIKPVVEAMTIEAITPDGEIT